MRGDTVAYSAHGAFDTQQKRGKKKTDQRGAHSTRHRNSNTGDVHLRLDLPIWNAIMCPHSPSKWLDMALKILDGALLQ